MDDDAGGDLDHEHRKNDVIEHFEERPIRFHHALAGFEPEDDGVDDDERHDHALGAWIIDDAAQPRGHGRPPSCPQP